MKPREKGGVVDARLNLYGVTNLKVAGECQFTNGSPIELMVRRQTAASHLTMLEAILTTLL